MPSISYQEYPSYDPKIGLQIRHVEISQDNIFITDRNGDIWQLWIEHDESPSIQLVKHG